MDPRASKFLRVAAGIIAAHLIGLVLWGICYLPLIIPGVDRIAPWLGVAAMFALWPSLILVPMAMGLAAAYVWRSLVPSIRESLLWWTISSLLTPLAIAVIWKEGLVCLLIGFPILLVGGFAGVMLGRYWFRPTSKMNLSIFPFLFVAVLLEANLRQDQRAVVTDRVLIRAPTGEVWKHVIAFEPIMAKPDYWLNQVGLPSPLATTCQGPFVGADRRCIFTGDLVFKEIVAEITPERLLTFDVVEQPNDPELLGHLTLHRGQFELIDNGDRTTTLIGRSWYTLHMRPIWYFDWWTRDITSHVHLRVMNHIRQLSESAP